MGRIDAKRDCIRAKFEDPVLRKALLATGSAALEERNGKEGGQSSGPFCGTGSDKAGGKGPNWAGKLLMEERERIRNLPGGGASES